MMGGVLLRRAPAVVLALALGLLIGGELLAAQEESPESAPGPTELFLTMLEGRSLTDALVMMRDAPAREGLNLQRIAAALDRGIERGESARSRHRDEQLLRAMLDAIHTRATRSDSDETLRASGVSRLRDYLAGRLAEYEDAGLRRMILLELGRRPAPEYKQAALSHGARLLRRFEQSGGTPGPEIVAEAFAYLRLAGAYSGPTLARIVGGIAESSRQARLVRKAERVARELLEPGG
jgi:hypothetical protein